MDFRIELKTIKTFNNNNSVLNPDFVSIPISDILDIGDITNKLFTTSLTVDTFSFNTATFKLNNESGKYGDISTGSSSTVFKSGRGGSLIRLFFKDKLLFFGKLDGFRCVDDFSKRQTKLVAVSITEDVAKTFVNSVLGDGITLGDAIRNISNFLRNHSEIQFLDNTIPNNQGLILDNISQFSVSNLKEILDILLFISGNILVTNNQETSFEKL